MSASWQQRVEYDLDADAIYVYLKDAKTARTVAVGDLCNIDYDSEDVAVGVELLGVGARIPLPVELA